MWEEDLLWMEPQTTCSGTNWTLLLNPTGRSICWEF